MFTIYAVRVETREPLWDIGAPPGELRDDGTDEAPNSLFLGVIEIEVEVGECKRWVL
jgi:hypothetical protein